MVPYSALTDYDRSVVLTLDDRPDPQLWGHCRSTHNSSMICFLCLQWFLFGILAIDGMSERNHCHIIIFSLHCFKGFLYGILADNAACHREAIAVQLACGDLRCPHGL